MSQLAIFGGTPIIKDWPVLSKMNVKYPLIERFTKYVGAQYGITTCNGTASVISALMGAGVNPGDEVITVSYSWFTSATSILAVGAIPVFIDVDNSFTMDPGGVEAAITARTKAILAVSLFGQPAAYDKLIPLARKHDLVVIDDACQSCGSAIGARRLGSVADITAFSFGGKPIVSTSGGMVTTDHREFYERALLAGQHPSYISMSVENDYAWNLASTGGYGMNLRIDEKSAERVYEQLERLDVINAYRRENARHLSHCLRDFPGITVPVERDNIQHIYHMHTSLFNGNVYGISRDEFVDALNAEGVPAIKYVSMANFIKTRDGSEFSAGPVHKRFLFRKLCKNENVGPHVFPQDSFPDYTAIELPNTDRFVEQEFNLQQKWLNPPFSKATMESYAAAVEKVLKHKDDIIKNRSEPSQWRRRPIFLTVDVSDG